jgi:hypothetical protein
MLTAPVELWWRQTPSGIRRYPATAAGSRTRTAGSIYVVDASTAKSSEVADGDNAEWLDDDTLIVSP